MAERRFRKPKVGGSKKAFGKVCYYESKGK